MGMCRQGPGKGSTGDTGRSSSRTSVFLGQTTQIFVFFYSFSPSGRVDQTLSRSRERGWLDSACWDVHALFPNPCKAAVSCLITGIAALSGVSMISGDLLAQEEKPWLEGGKMISELKETSIGDMPKITLQLKLSLTQQERQQCLYSLENVWGAGTECVQNLWGTSVSWGKTTALNQNQILSLITFFCWACSAATTALCTEGNKISDKDLDFSAFCVCITFRTNLSLFWLWAV